MQRFKIYLELVRPFTLIAPMIGLLSGSVIASGAVISSKIILGVFTAAMLNAASNVNNHYFDLEIDKINKPFRPLPSGKIPKAHAMIFALLLYFSALSLSCMINRSFFSIVLLTALITFFYSAPPLRIKRYPFLSNAAIALPRGMFLIVAGWSMTKPIANIEPWFIGSIFALYLLGAATTKDFSDTKGDSSFGIKTLPVVYGPKRAARMISPFFYLPFLLIPFGVFAGLIRFATLPLTLLSLWGFYTAKLIMRKPEELALERNHISWKHMYLMLIGGQIGFAAAYLLKP